MAHKRDEIAAEMRHRILGGLHLGVVRHGDRLSSVRAVGAELSADPRVVLAAYRQLEEEGLVEVRPRSGIYVAPTAGGEHDALPQLAEWVVGILGQARGRGVSPVTLPDRLRACLQTVRIRAVCIECNRDQIAGLCGELRRDYGVESAGVEVEDLSSGDLPEEVRRADLLVTTTFHAKEVQRVAESLRKPWIEVHLRPRFLAEVARFLQQGPVYFVATDARFGEKLRHIFSSTGKGENLRSLIVGRDDLADIPEDSPTYVMPAARPQVQEGALRSRLIPAPRVFSDESAAELLSFIVQTNLRAESEDDPPPRPSSPARLPPSR